MSVLRRNRHQRLHPQLFPPILLLIHKLHSTTIRRTPHRSIFNAAQSEISLFRLILLPSFLRYTIFLFFYYQRLYRNGARKVAVVELGELGCMPAVMAAYGSPNSSRCVETSNDVVRIFNRDLKLLIYGLNHVYPEAEFVHVRDIALTASTGTHSSLINSIFISSPT